jgi:hypothetical protein
MLFRSVLQGALHIGSRLAHHNTYALTDNQFLKNYCLDAMCSGGGAELRHDLGSSWNTYTLTRNQFVGNEAAFGAGMSISHVSRVRCAIACV